MKKALIASFLVLLFVISCATTKANPAEPVEVPSPVRTETVIAAESKGLPFGDDLTANVYWRQVVASPSMEARALEMAGRNLVILSDDELVINSVRSGQFLVGILPADAEVPEGCIEPVAIK
ncbi:MAG: hypothetical protein KBS81_03860 [Spirochaetales bacterium]|nr:hypothetical protein [Candidatus Physcosoma equi]